MKLLDALIGVLFPASCQNCGNAAVRGTELCPDCAAQFLQEAEECCPMCGLTAPLCVCNVRFGRHTQTTIGEREFLVLTFYQSRKGNNTSQRLTETMIFRLKSHGTYAKFFAHRLAHAIRLLFDEAGEDLSSWRLTYLPRTTQKYVSCGLDQSEEIAGILAQQLHIPLERLFGRLHGEEQKRLNHEQRQENAEDSLILIRQPAENGKYLLLDDIITSGATMEAAARQLRFAGASALFPVAAARSMPKSRKNEEEMIENTEI